MKMHIIMIMAKKKCAKGARWGMLIMLDGTRLNKTLSRAGDMFAARG